jgi:hypothetical protein
VTTYPTVSLDTIVERVTLDPVGFVERMLQEALDQMARDGTLTANGDRPPEEWVATALGRHLGRVITADTSTDKLPSAPASTVGADGPAPIDVAVIDDYEQLLERNSALAAAVGACDCFGQHADCPMCDGEGSPGWVRPDSELFATFVYPAVRLVSRRRRER